jgi:hypothetical protein
LPKVWPEVIPPTVETEQELAFSMFEDRAPEMLPLEPTWASNLPEGYVHCITQVDTKLAPGLGEFCMQLAMHKDCPMQFLNCGHKRPAFRLPVNLGRAIKRSGLLAQLGEAHCPSDVAVDAWSIQINASKDYSLELLLKARDIIVDSRVFPIWRLSEVKAESHDVWKKLADKSEQIRGPKTLLERTGL